MRTAMTTGDRVTIEIHSSGGSRPSGRTGPVIVDTPMLNNPTTTKFEDLQAFDMDRTPSPAGSARARPLKVSQCPVAPWASALRLLGPAIRQA